MSTTTDRRQPALVGGLIVGVLSALPIISAGNLCCCLWVVSGGVVAAYMLQQNQVTPITAADGAVVGLLAGLVGAFVHLALSIPITILIAPMERLLMQRIIENSGTMGPGFRDYVGTYVGAGVRITLGFLFMLSVGSVFAALGGLLGAVIFGKKLPPGAIDVPASS